MTKIKYTFASIVSILALALLALMIDNLLTAHPSASPNIGFFSPRGVDATYAAKVDFAMINASDIPSMLTSLELARKNGLKVYIDLGTIIMSVRDPSKLKREYVGTDLKLRSKRFEPLSMSKVFQVFDDPKLTEILSPFFKSLADYTDQIAGIFLVDEPYLNGVTKAELERAGKVVRKIFKDQTNKDVKLGVMFSGADFNAEFAQNSQKNALAYAQSIDDYALKLKTEAENNPSEENKDALKQWTTIISERRLTTYDQAGNLYDQGGVPEGFDIAAFDFYLSTLLLDSLYDNSLSLFARIVPNSECRQFADSTMADVRKKLSFFQDGAVLQDNHVRETDRVILDNLYQCRMGATVHLLKQEIERSKNPNMKLIVTTESSTAGVFEYDSGRSIENDQPELLIQSRVADEVARGVNFMKSNSADIDSMMFFTFENEYDANIKLHIGGVSNMPNILDQIYSSSNRNKAVPNP